MLKQKLSNLKNSHSKKSILAIFCLILFFVFFYSHNADAITWTEWVKSPFSSTALGLVVFLLKLMLKFTSFLLSSAETLFVYIVDPDNMKSIMDNNAIYTTWRTVRDVFNIAFIMVLLFSAFCTIFQYSNYGIKTIWRNLVLMALLVNFSYPIARFIIDASNMLMYGFLNNLGGTNSFLVLIEQSGLSKIIGTDSPDPLYLLSAVVFTFIFAITLLTIAILLVIRTITLAIYIIFSPIAFTGSILPGTALASSASSWWTDFMKQCFAGPIIIFFLYIANKMMLAVSSSQDGLKNIAVKQVPGGVPVGSIEGLADLIAAASFFALPIIILWYGIIMAQKSGIAGAEMAVGYGKTAGKWLAKNPALGSVGFISKKSGLTGGVQQKWENWKKTGIFGSERTAQRESIVASKGPFKVKGAALSDMKRRAEQLKKDNVDKTELSSRAEKGDAAAAYRLATDGDINTASFSGAMEKIKDKSIKDAIEGKVREKRVDVVIDYKIKARGGSITPTEKLNIAEEEIGKIAPSKWKDQNLNELFGYNSATKILSTDPDIAIRRDAAKNKFNSYTGAGAKNRDKITDDMNGEKYTAGMVAGIW